MSSDWHDNALHDRRQWLGDLQPQRVSSSDDPGYEFAWGPDCDAAIAVHRKADPLFDAVFTLADQHGIAILPAHQDGDRRADPHVLLMEMAYSLDDSDWIVVTRRGSHADYTADLMTGSVHSTLAPCSFECHATPSWCVRITHHA